MLEVKIWQLFVVFAFGWRGYWTAFKSLTSTPYEPEGIDYMMSLLVAGVCCLVSVGLLTLAHHITIAW